MNIKKLLANSLTAAALLVSAGAANADLYTFTETAVGGFGAGTYGTVTLTQSGTSVDVNVALRSDLDFVVTGGPHSIFSFNLLGISSTLDITNVHFFGGDSTNISLVKAVEPGANTPFGTFTFMLDCVSSLTANCQQGAGGALYDPLTFTVLNAVLADFAVANAQNVVFAADVLCSGSTLPGCNGETGAIAAGMPGGPPPTEIPEPASLALVGLALLGGGLARRRKV